MGNFCSIPFDPDILDISAQIVHLSFHNFDPHGPMGAIPSNIPDLSPSHFRASATSAGSHPSNSRSTPHHVLTSAGMAIGKSAHILVWHILGRVELYGEFQCPLKWTISLQEGIMWTISCSGFTKFSNGIQCPRVPQPYQQTCGVTLSSGFNPDKGETARNDKWLVNVNEPWFVVVCGQWTHNKMYYAFNVPWKNLQYSGGSLLGMVCLKVQFQFEVDI